MIEIRFHGRGGQGAVTAAELLALAAFFEGKYSQSFPEIGVERRGAPIMAFCRIDDKPIIIRCGVYEPDCIVVLDASLIGTADILKGFKKSGWLVLNTNKNPENFKELAERKICRLAIVNATGIALRNSLGNRVAPIVNTTVLGAFAKISEIIKLESVLRAISEKIKQKPSENIRACKEAYEQVRVCI